MIDPITALAVASTAVCHAKSLLAAGRDATSALSKFAGAVSDVNYAAEKAKKPGLLALLTGSAEQAAIDAFAAQKKMQAMRKEIETIIQYQYGPKGLEEYKDTLRRVRAERKRTAYRQAEFKEAVIFWGGTLVICSVTFVGLAAVFFFLGHTQGKW